MTQATQPTNTITTKRKPLLSKQLRNDLRAYAFVLPWLIGLLVFIAYPMVASFYFSFTKYNILEPPKWVGLSNFTRMFTSDPQFWTATGNTIYYALISVPLSLAVALGLALLLNRSNNGIGFYRTIFYLPSLVPAIATTLIWMLLLDARLGLVNVLLSSLGVPRIGWFQSAAWSKPGLILMTLWTGTGSAMLIFLAGLKEVPKPLLEAAMIDGANSWQRLRHVTIPLLTPTIFFNLIMGIISSFQIFTPVFVALGAVEQSGVGGMGPLNSLLMYMLHLYRFAFRFFEMGYASAMATLMFIVLILLTLLVVRSSNYWVHYEGSKR